MLDLRLIREQTDAVVRRLATKAADAPVGQVVEADQRRRALLSEVERLKSERNAASKDLGARKKRGEATETQQQALRELGERIKQLDADVRTAEQTLQDAQLLIPNVPHPSVPVGASAEDNRVVRHVGEAKRFDFEPKSHWDLGAALGIMDLERASRMSGSGFPLLLGDGARLQRALIQFMLDIHTREHGYREVAPPYLVNTNAMVGTGQLPKMAEDMYEVPGDGLWLIPTAEVPVTNLFREEILDRPLPIYLTAFTPCFRREAGAAGRDTRGLIRVHQFDKVELVKFVAPGTSYDELEDLLGHAAAILDRLELHYRVIELCTADLSFAAAKCYDIELWAPAQQRWLEVSSCSNFEDFQARRAGIRYRGEDGKPAFVHTLNGSGVALPRLMVALLETFQERDGTVSLPAALHPYLGGLERLEPPAK